MDQDHLFQGKEIDAILRSAARLQTKEQESNEKAGEGLSLRELEEIAKESGIDPVYIRQAAFLGDEADFDEKKFHLFGAPTSDSEDFVLDRPLSKEEREKLVPVIRKISKTDGYVESLTDSLVWHETKSKRSQPRTSVSILSDNDKSIVRVQTKGWFVGFITHYVAILPAVLFAISFMAEKGFSPTILGVTLAVVATLILVARFVYSKYHDSRMDKVHKIKAAIKKSARSQISENTSSGQVNFEDLDYLSEEVTTTEIKRVQTK